MSPTLLRGEPVASDIRREVEARVDTLHNAGVTPTLATVLASNADAAHRFMDLKHDACDSVGIETIDQRLHPDTSERELLQRVEESCRNPAVAGVFVQTPLPDQVSLSRVRNHLDPTKDVDCFHPTNLGRLVTGDARFVPATTMAVERLLDAYDISVSGADVVLVGRSPIIGVPLANRLIQDSPGGNATVTVCHSRTVDLASKTRQADILITACGAPGLVDTSMLSKGVVVVDVSATQRDTNEGGVVGDVDESAAREKARAWTPVPGGVGPVTLAALLENVVLAAECRHAPPER